MGRISRWRGISLAAILFAASQTGCVQRRLTIRSDPPGALVYVDDYQIGTTPCSTSFLYYGKRKIRLVKDGYETLTVDHRFWPPLYEVPPLDFVSENIVPWELRDEQAVNFKLVPQQLTPTDQLLERAENLRRGSRVQLTPPGPVTVLPGQTAPTVPGQPGTTAPVQPPNAPGGLMAAPPLSAAS